MPEIQIVKYECMENDFCIVDQDHDTLRWTPRRVAHLCHRRRGLGSDGLIVLKSVDRNAVQFRLFNADGSGAEWSGNGVRCAAAFVHNQRHRSQFTMETKAGAIPVTCSVGKRQQATVSIDCPVPSLRALGRATTNRLRRARGPYAVDAGNPHWVYLVPDFEFDWESVGKSCQKANRKTHGVNVEFVQIISKQRVAMRLFERGVGPTPSSGSGALAGTMVCRHLDVIEPRVQVESPGGVQTIDYATIEGAVRLTATANFVFSGKVAIP
jgi:diaminopimelate epimerase